jgi:hypothetical protein
MLGEALQHMIEKADPGFDVGLSSAIQINGYRDIGFLGGTGNGGGTIIGHLGPYSGLNVLQLARFVH